MFIRSGELVIILGGKIKIRHHLFKSLRLLLMVMIIISGMIPCLIIRGVVLKSNEGHIVSFKMAEIQNQCTILGNQASSSGLMSGGVSETFDAELTQFSNIYNGRVLVIDRSYKIVDDTYGTDIGKTVISGDVVRCFEGESISRYDDKNSYIEITTPIQETTSGKTVGVLLASISTDNILSIQDNLEQTIDIVVITALVVLAVLSFFASMYIMRPMNRMTKAVQSMTESYDEDYLHEETFAETKRFSEAFNKMIERFKVLDESRQEFVSNVSHELKTPITSMKVLADSLLAQEEVPAELYREFMADMSEEIERENKIINDLLSLVKMDKTTTDMNIENLNINEVVERILKRLRPIAEKQNIEVLFESFRPVEAEIDETKFSLCVSNLVENAIKYNHENGWVHVSLNADHKFFYLKVTDSGIGIPKEAQEHIFERFYRVDKSHSREIGGTGLGLAIARNSVIMHRGAIKVYSEEGEGTTFTVRMPLKYVASAK
ncbi:MULTISPECIES: sensor histidine kinase [Sellimonas]|uniref:histidine kinase n=1 Tax=Sellimonas caecigallum TaxID=2592333 RepID=A0ABS7L5K3_9FIRM|nr:HAMP domain-containing sensor histidine kinase [Sellimonas caecigallum]MBY0758305.1 HAMP domain-containing histidine kinase [Sellimonas caecigallum]OUP66420.1 two-component sensor histidine kinase [Drancourtella sp. An177]